MLGVKKWAIRFIAAVVLVSAFLPFTQLLTPDVQAAGESFTWNKTPAGYPEIIMEGGKTNIFGDFMSGDGSSITLRPTGGGQKFKYTLTSDDQIQVTSSGADTDNSKCTVRVVVDVDKGLTTGQMWLQIATPSCRQGQGFLDVNANIARKFYQQDFGSAAGFEKKNRITIGSVTSLRGISPELDKIFNECAAPSGSPAFNQDQCIAEKAAKLDVTDAGGNDKEEATCVGGALGWFLCPFSEAAAGTMEALGGLIQGLLKVQPLDVTTPGTGNEGGENDTSAAIYIIWNAMRNIANILFIIFFLVIIFSYITSIGISNYGIKRTLPRLIVAAILVNISYFICAILIDIFNILGASIEGLFQNGINAAVSASEETRPGATGGQRFVVGTIAAGILTGVLLTAGPSILLLLLAPLISALIAVLMLGAILIARQFLITLLVVFSPLIAVAWLLPGTEKFFKKGVNAGIGALASYPIVMAVVMGAELLVAFMTVTGVAPGVPGGGPNEALTAIGVLLMQILVVVIVITVLKNGTRIMSFISGRAGMMGKGGGGLFAKAPAWAKGKAADVRGRSRQAFRRKDKQAFRSARAQAGHDYRRRRALEGASRVPGSQSRAQRRAEQLAAWQNQANERKRAETQHVGRRLSDTDYQQEYAGSEDTARMAAALASGVKAASSMRTEELAAHKLVLENDPTVNFERVAAGQDSQYNSDTYRIAALQAGREQGQSNYVQSFLENAHTLQEPGSRNEVLNELAQNHGAYRGVLAATANGDQNQGLRSKIGVSQITESDIQQATKEVIRGGKVAPNALAASDTKNLGHIETAMKEIQQDASNYQLESAHKINEARDTRTQATAAQASGDTATYTALTERARALEAEAQEAAQKQAAAVDDVTRTQAAIKSVLDTPTVRASAKPETIKKLEQMSGSVDLGSVGPNPAPRSAAGPSNSAPGPGDPGFHGGI